MNEFAISAARREDGLVTLTRFTGKEIASVVLNEPLSAAMARHLEHERAHDYAASLWVSCEAVPALAAERSTTAFTIH